MDATAPGPLEQLKVLLSAAAARAGAVTFATRSFAGAQAGYLGPVQHVDFQFGR
jgi:hypothetical protein